MKDFDKILKGIEIIKIIGNINIQINEIHFDSRKVKNCDVFVAVKGTQSDGHDYIAAAIEKGAKIIVCEHLPENRPEGVAWVVVKDSAAALGILISKYFDNPSEKLSLVGVTGTNGKTTTATFLYRLFKLFGHKVGLISTVVYKVDEKEYESTHTTPDALTLNNLLYEMVNEGCKYCFMEVSSHSLAQNRTAGLKFAGAIFTNITHDHLDYHLTFDNYLKSKKLLFDNLDKNSFALINIDDRNGRIMVQNTKAKVKTYALHTLADFKAKIIESHFGGMQLQINGTDFLTPLVGEFNAYNILAVYGAAILLGADKIETLKLLSTFKEVSGRFETLRSKNGIIAIVDYAHTPDALVNVLKTIHQIKNSSQKIITVVGAGGNRDKTKRPIMAKVCSEMSDKVILTSDNPRFEEPEDIINDMLAGVEESKRNNVVTIVNRHEAIKTSVMLAQSNDIILLAGKGHETYQDIKGVKHHFDDKEEIIKIFNTL